MSVELHQSTQRCFRVVFSLLLDTKCSEGVKLLFDASYLIRSMMSWAWSYQVAFHFDNSELMIMNFLQWSLNVDSKLNCPWTLTTVCSQINSKFTKKIQLYTIYQSIQFTLLGTDVNVQFDACGYHTHWWGRYCTHKLDICLVTMLSADGPTTRPRMHYFSLVNKFIKNFSFD